MYLVKLDNKYLVAIQRNVEGEYVYFTADDFDWMEEDMSNAHTFSDWMDAVSCVEDIILPQAAKRGVEEIVVQEFRNFYTYDKEDISIIASSQKEN